MVIRLVSVPEDLELIEFHKIFRTLLGWSSSLDYIFRVHGQEFNSFRRASRSKRLQDFQLHRQEKFLYICDAIGLWEWDVRVVDIQPGAPDHRAPVCLGGRGATPPEFCGGPRGYRLLSNGKRREPPCRPRCCWKPAFRCWPPLIRSNRPALGICCVPRCRRVSRISIKGSRNMDHWNQIASG
jgi:hypothetical protein